MPTRVLYERKLKDLYDNIFKMGIAAKNALQKAGKAFDEQDAELAKEVKKNDILIDRQQVLIDQEIITCIATEHPVAQDLREIVSSLKISVEIERFADHAVHLARCVLKLGQRPPERYVQAVDTMVKKCTQMMDDVMTAFLEQNSDTARSIAKQDDQIDAIHKEYVRSLLAQKDVSDIETIATLLFAGHYLERMGDHVTNICEWIVYGELAEQVDLNA